MKRVCLSVCDRGREGDGEAWMSQPRPDQAAANRCERQGVFLCVRMGATQAGEASWQSPTRLARCEFQVPLANSPASSACVGGRAAGEMGVWEAARGGNWMMLDCEAAAAWGEPRDALPRYCYQHRGPGHRFMGQASVRSARPSRRSSPPLSHSHCVRFSGALLVSACMFFCVCVCTVVHSGACFVTSRTGASRGSSSTSRTGGSRLAHASTTSPVREVLDAWLVS